VPAGFWVEREAQYFCGFAGFFLCGVVLGVLVLVDDAGVD
jgi:hypothetical protein